MKMNSHIRKIAPLVLLVLLMLPAMVPDASAAADALTATTVKFKLSKYGTTISSKVGDSLVANKITLTSENITFWNFGLKNETYRTGAASQLFSVDNSNLRLDNFEEDWENFYLESLAGKTATLVIISPGGRSPSKPWFIKENGAELQEKGSLDALKGADNGWYFDIISENICIKTSATASVEVWWYLWYHLIESWTGNVVSAFTGSGSGTAEDPYIITNVNQLQEMNNHKTAYYALGNDIDASATRTWNDNGTGGYYGFLPIGTSSTTFTGGLDGRRYKIYNLYINRPATINIGLFGYVGSGGTVENVGLENENINGSWAVGGLVGYNNYGTVSKCYSTGSVKGVTAGDVGGLVGLNRGTVSNSYSTGSVSGTFYIGGLVGWNYGTVSKCYSTGSVSGSTYVGGLVGRNSSGTITNSFWDNETSGTKTSAGGTWKTTENMKDVRTFTDNTWSENLTSPWDFVGNPPYDENNEDIWNIHPAVNNGYPFLTGLLSIPEWRQIETWTGTVTTTAAWQLIESWTGTVSAPAQWNLIETWTGTVSAPAAWQLVETWTGTVNAPTVPPPPPPADFSISVYPTSGEVVQGGSTTATVTVAPSGGYGYTVSLTASGRPSGVVITLLPNSGAPSFTSTMAINVSRSAPAGTYTITITGTGADGKVHSTIYTLKIATVPLTIPVSAVNAISPYWQTSVPFAITATASDIDGYVTNVTLWYRYSTDNLSWENWVLFMVDNSEPWSWSFAASRGDGYYEFYSIAWDNDNNEEPVKFQAEARCGVDRAAPPAPRLISPADGTKTRDTTPTFDWSDATDLSGITYEFKIEAYGSLVMIKTCISSSYAIEANEALPESIYHWYARAVDGAGNFSDWSEARSFTIELVPPITVKLGTISANVPQVADFTQYNIFVIKVTITTLRDVRDAEVSIKESIGKPAWVSEPSGIMYTVYATITTNIAPSDIGSVIVLFQLPKLWITQNGVDDGTIKLLKTGSDWHTLSTTRIEADENYAYFEAATSGFSLFVATGEKASPLPPPSGLPLLPLVILSIIAVGIGGLIAYRLMRPSRYFTILRRLERAVVRPRKRQIGERVRPPAMVHRRVSRADRVALRRLERIMHERERRPRELEVELPVRVRKRAIMADRVALRRLEHIMRERKKKWARETRKKLVKRKVKQKKSTKGRKKLRPKQ